MKRRFENLSFIFSIIVALVGFVVLIGWTKNILILKSISPYWISMKANTAFCFLLSGFTLIIFNFNKKSRGTEGIGYFFSFIICIIAITTLIEYFSGYNLGIDELFFKDNAPQNGTASPGRIALGTSICFTIFGCSFLLSGIKSINHQIFQWLYLVVGVIAFAALIGYLFGIEQLTGIAKHTTLAIHTSITLIILMLAALFIKPEVGFMKLISSDTAGGKLFRNTFPPFILVILILSWARLQGELYGLYLHELGNLIWGIVVVILFALILYRNSFIITESQQSLKQSEIQLRAIINNLPVGLLLIDNNFKVIEINELESSYCRMMFDKPIVRDENLLDVITGKKKELFINNYNKILDKKPAQYFVTHTELDNKEWIFDIHLNPVIDENEIVVGACISIEDVTERRNAEIKINQLSQAMEQSPASVVITDPAGNIQYVNPKFTKVSGYSAEEVIGKNPRFLKTGYTSESEYQNLWEKLVSGDEWQGIMQNKKKSGEIFWESAAISPIKNENGEIISFIAIKEDITERKRLEQRFAAAFNDSPSAMSISHIDERTILDVNKSYKRILGYTRQELVGHKVSERGIYVDAHDREKIIELINKNGSVRNMELEVINKSGAIVNILGSFSAIEVEGKSCLLSAFTDITEQKQAEINSRRLTHQLTEVGASMPGAMFQCMLKTDKSFSFPFLSKGIEQLVGNNYEEITKEPNAAFDFIHPEDLPIILLSIQESAANLSPWLQFFRLSQGNDEYKWIRGNAIPGKLANGNILWNGTLIDVTEQKLAELNLIKNNTELQKTNKELDSFVYSTSHDLKAPLTSILGLLNLIEVEKSIDTQKMQIEMMRASVSKLNHFIGDILDYSRNRSFDLIKEEIDFNKILAETYNNLNFMKDKERIRLEEEIDASVPFFGDKMRIGIILTNLVSNSIKYCDNNKESPYIQITIRTYPDKATIKIEDNGIGIADKHLPKIFDMFYRGSVVSSGSGIGLYIVKENILKMNGTIQAKSELNKFTTLTIDLPNNSN